MQAAVYTPGSPFLDIVDNFPIPEPGPNEVLLKIKASGVCHSDIFFLSQFASDPRTCIMGHETSSIVTQLGSKVDRHKIKEGQLYAVQSLGGCACCAHLPKTGWPVGITNITGFGLGGNGGHAQFAAVDEKLLVPVPDGVLPEHAAVMADAGITVYHALHRVANVRKGEKVLIVGVGGLGLLAVQMAKRFGAEVYALDIKPPGRALAKEFGAIEAFHLQELDARTTEGFTVDTVVDFVGTRAHVTFARDIAALQSNVILSDISRGGRIILMSSLHPNTADAIESLISVKVGVSDENLPLNAAEFVTTKISVLTSFYGSRQDLIEVLDFVAKGAIKPQVEKAPLEQANEVMNELRANAVRSRKVLVPRGCDD